MRVTLVRCPWWVRYCPPYILAFFASLLRSRGHEVKVLDINNILYHRAPENLRKFWDDRDSYSVWEDPAFVERISAPEVSGDIVSEVLSNDPETVCFTTHTPNALFSQRLASRLKKESPSTVTLFMGHKCSRTQMAFDFIEKPYIDYVCTGEADAVLPGLLEKLEKSGSKDLPEHKGFLLRKYGRVLDGGAPDYISDIDSLPFPDYSDFEADIKTGSYSMPGRLDILDSRGCVNSCHFCYERLYWGRYRAMSGERLFSQIREHRKRFPGVDFFYFNGLLLNGSPGRLERFCDLVIENGEPIRWAGQAAVGKNLTGKLLEKMSRAGCSWLGYGVESGSDRVLREMNKKHTVADALRVLKDTKRAGISVQINVMFGYPTETREDFSATLDFLRIARPFIDSVLASQSFCTLEKKTFLKENPERFGISESSHHLYWKSLDGQNNYAERFRRYEEFCREALTLGIPETSGVLSKKPDKWGLIGDYYFYEKDYEKAAESYERSILEEAETKTVYNKLARVYRLMGEKKRSDACELKAGSMRDPFREAIRG